MSRTIYRVYGVTKAGYKGSTKMSNAKNRHIRKTASINDPRKCVARSVKGPNGPQNQLTIIVDGIRSNAFMIVMEATT